MRNRFYFQPKYFLYWLLVFALGRAAFLLYHLPRTQQLDAGSIARTFIYGVRLDGSAAAYLCIAPFMLLAVAGWFPQLRVGRIIGIYTGIVGAVVALLTVADLELYRAWGFRLDNTPLQYLNSPGEMAASAGSSPLLLLTLILGGLLLVGYLLYRPLLASLPPQPAWFSRVRAVAVGLLYAVLLIVPLRGGVQQIPVNQSDVYFSTSRPFANHAAINVPWNVVQSLPLGELQQNPYQYLPDTTARRLVAQLYLPAPAGAPAPRVLRTPRPNVLFVILESFTGKLVGHLGGERGVTPTLDSLARTGLSFRNIYASGDRSQKGIVALLSGYPNQPTTSIIKFPRKTENLPNLARSLGAVGYESSFYYGGELAFANMKSYLLAGGYQRLVERQDFRRRDQNSKWGAHDHVLFNRVLRDLRQQPAPFFATVFTLSSHEPFEVPMRPRFRGTSETQLFRNSVAYTDHALGQFLRAARQQPWWGNTVVVIAADHGHHLPGNSGGHEPAKFHIPLLLTGGALRPEFMGRSVATFGSQTDVATTLLAQLGLPSQEYAWGRNLLAPAPPAAPGGFAFYCFTDGFGLIRPQGVVTMDNDARRIIERDSATSPLQLRQGQAYQQQSFADFLRR
ncbi:LTA synthase family protein [Hymenobacter latericus]|uniref:LTA synthase family protein n=1 Tax=Hymenobacter sp. YIM 151858-1 TaxID=2987688 RepID=UPI0022276ABC|nr:LTA synthase family protein [Hymenobacter sp. YIM 151858-1]UYZ59982.1 LTA synthase family protein [Hymenobacter sp. YIM 151858-1]